MKIECLLTRAGGCAGVNIKETQWLDHIVLKHFEVVLLQAFHWLALGVRHDDI